MNKSDLTIVVALDDRNGIGRDNRIPWHIKDDLKFFRLVTTTVADSSKHNAIIVGRKTYETFTKPLPNRLNIVVSRNPMLPNIQHDNVIRVDSFVDALKCANDDKQVENIFIVGGVSIYEAAMESNLVKRMLITRVKGDYQCTAVWSSFNTTHFTRVKTLPTVYRDYFQYSNENSSSTYHLEIYERDC
jgi:dihydrofolate reductase